MMLIVGLGNPGKEYENTYHNIGFMALDFYLKNLGLTLNKKKDNSLILEEKINSKKIIFCKPLTYMNLSGTSVVALSNKFKVEKNKILIIYDDIDLEEGVVRFRKEGSAGTHNGMKDIINKMGTTEVARIRIGIGKPTHKEQDLANFVLSKIKNKDLYEPAFLKVKEILDEFILNEGKLENKSAI